MADQPPLREQESINWEFFLDLPEADRTKFIPTTIKNSQLYATALRVLRRLCRLRRNTLRQAGIAVIWRPDTGSQRDRMLLHLWRKPAHHPWAHNKEGRGPSWSNSLFEDNAEFGLGMRLTLDKHLEMATNCCR